MLEYLETDRCVLRKVSVDDAAAIFSTYAQDAEVTKFLTRKPHVSIHDTYDFLQSCIAAWESGKEYTYAVVDKEDQSFMGMFSLREKESGVGSFGYVLARPFWGQGYMTEVLQAMISVGFSSCGFKKIIGYCDVENVGSAKVMEHAGMSFVGIYKSMDKLPAFDYVQGDDKLYEIYPV